MKFKSIMAVLMDSPRERKVSFEGCLEGVYIIKLGNPDSLNLNLL